MFKKVTGAAHAHVFHHHVRAAKDNFEGNGFNTSVAQYRLKVNEFADLTTSELLLEEFRIFAPCRWTPDPEVNSRWPPVGS